MISRNQKNEKSSPPPERASQGGGVPVNIGFSRANSPSCGKVKSDPL